MTELWTCPYCNRPCTIGGNDIRELSEKSFINSMYGTYRGRIKIITCPNVECRKQTISLTISSCDNYGLNEQAPFYSARLIPESSAKPFPSYIPEAILHDYNEACLIQEKSPKASATLSRRCLQGMIRDFWGIKKDRLFDEIKDLEGKVEESTWEAIDSVRKVGNIGAHMEKDVDLIIDVDSDEAALLIWLIETLFEDWYIAKHEREERMAKIRQIAENKINLKAAQKNIQL